MKMKKKIMSLVLAAAMVMSLGAGFSAGAVTEEDAGAPIDPMYDLEYIQSLPETEGVWVPMDSFAPISNQMDAISAYQATPSYVKMLSGIYDSEKVYAVTDEGAYFYAMSTAMTRSSYVGAFVNVELPQQLERGQRNAFISLGANNNGNLSGSLRFIDAGLSNTGNGWKPTYYSSTGATSNTPAYEFNNYTIPSDATNVIMMLGLVNGSTTQLQFYLQPCVGTTPIGNPFNATLTPTGWNFSNKYCFFRFASLVPANGVNNMFDGTCMRGAAFTNCQMYTSSNSYEAWGIHSKLMERAWSVNPSHISVYSTTYNDAFNIFYSNS